MALMAPMALMVVRTWMAWMAMRARMGTLPGNDRFRPLQIAEPPCDQDEHPCKDNEMKY